MKTKESIYAIYKGDKFIDLGTIKQLAKRLNLNEQTVRKYGTPTYKNNGNREYDEEIFLIKIEGDEDEII